jgi:hypothetical protein
MHSNRVVTLPHGLTVQTCVEAHRTLPEKAA